MASNAELVELTNQYLIANYGRLPIAMVRGEGARIWDADEKEYLDFFPGFGAGGIAGHCHPDIANAVAEQAELLMCAGNLFTNPAQVELARALAEKGFGGKTFFCHSGAEANEAARKLARLYAGPGRYKIISFNGCFHGRTMGALSLTPEKYHKGFEPMLPGNVKVDYMDLAAVTAAVDDETAGIIVEPIQGEGGVNVPTVEYMQGLRALCDEHKIALISDEVWTSPARTGKWFAYQHYDIEPDIMTLGKALGGGAPVEVMPLIGRISRRQQRRLGVRLSGHGLPPRACYSRRTSNRMSRPSARSEFVSVSGGARRRTVSCVQLMSRPFSRQRAKTSLPGPSSSMPTIMPLPRTALIRSPEWI